MMLMAKSAREQRRVFINIITISGVVNEWSGEAVKRIATEMTKESLVVVVLMLCIKRNMCGYKKCPEICVWPNEILIEVVHSRRGWTTTTTTKRER